MAPCANVVDSDDRTQPLPGNNVNSRLNYCLQSSICNISSGILLVFVGVSIIGFTFHNNNDHTENRSFLIGSLLIVAGLLSTGKAIVRHRRVAEHQRHGQARDVERTMDQRRRYLNMQNQLNRERMQTEGIDLPPAYDVCMNDLSQQPRYNAPAPPSYNDALASSSSLPPFSPDAPPTMPAAAAPVHQAPPPLHQAPPPLHPPTAQLSTL